MLLTTTTTATTETATLTDAELDFDMFAGEVVDFSGNVACARPLPLPARRRPTRSKVANRKGADLGNL